MLSMISSAQYIDKIGNYKFLENKGQWPNELAYKGTIPNGDLFFFNDGIGYLLNQPDSTHAEHQHPEFTGHEQKTAHTHAVKLSFENSLELNWQSIDQSSNYFNFLYGSDSTKWHSKLHTSQQLLAQNIYQNIDIRLILHPKTGFKYEFVVAKETNYKQIKLNFDGAEKIEIINNELHIKTSVGTIIENPPFAYQMVDGKRQKVACKYVIKRGVISFKLGNYNKTLPLTIDPKLIFSTSAGSRADYWGNTACNDDDGNLYTGGTIFSHDGRGFPTPTGFPTTTGAFETTFQGGYTDIGIMKFDSSGTSLIYSTYLGGNDSEIPTSLVVDETTQELLILGTTGSSNFPIPNPANSFDPTFSGSLPVLQNDLVGGYEFTQGTDIIVIRLSNDGTSIINSTYLGGTGTDGINRKSDELVFNYGDQLRGDIFLDDSGSVYIASVTSLPTDPLDSFPTIGGFSPNYLGGASDGVLVKMKGDLSDIIWSNHIGSDGTDACFSVKVDSNFNVIVAGGTNDTIHGMPTNGANPFPIGDVDGFVMRISADGTTPIAGSYIGTSSFDQAYFVDLDEDETVYVLGQTEGLISSFSVFGPVYNNPNNGLFITKFSQDLSTTLISTTIGDTTNPAILTSNISPTAFLVNDCGNIFISGWGGFINSSGLDYRGDFIKNMPITDKAYKNVTDGDDFYLVVLFKNAELLLYGTYFGGNTSLEHVDGGTSRFDKAGTVYQSVCANCGANRDFPTFPDDGNNLTYPMRSKSFNCNNGLFKFDLANLEAIIEGPTCLTTNEEYYFKNLSTGGIDYYWDFGDGSAPVITEKADSVSHTYTLQGQYTIMMIATDLVTCIGKDTTYFDVNVINEIEIIGDTIFCPNENLPLVVNNSINPEWYSSGALTCNFCSATVASPTDTTWYFVKDSIGNSGCSSTDSIRIDLNTLPLVADFDLPTCDFIDKDIVFINNSIGGHEYTWDFGDGTTLFTTSDTNVTHQFTQRKNYSISLTVDNDSTCLKTTSIQKQIGLLHEITAYVDTTICPLKSVVLSVDDALLPEWSPSSSLSCTWCQSPTAAPQDTTYYVVKDSIPGGCFTTDTVLVNVQPKPNPQIIITTTDLRCYDEPVSFTGTINENDCECCVELTDWFWDFGDGFTSTETKPTHLYKAEGIYNVSLRAKGYDTVIGFQPIELYTLDSCLKNIFIPNAFSPNDDGENDILYVRGINVIKLDFRLFNRWGEEVFYTDRLSKGWDAYYKKQKQTQQVFVFKCTATFYDGEVRKFEGNITLLE